MAVSGKMGRMDLGLKDRVYVVTGASRGLGRAAAQELAAEGAHLVVSSRDAEAVQRTVDELGAQQCAGIAADNADAGTADRLVAAAQERWGRLDGALVSVGGPPPGGGFDATEEQWRGAFESVFLGALRLARAVARDCEDGGSLAFVLSSSVRQPIPGLAISNGLRPGLAMLAKTLADELGPAGMRVNGLLPGRIDTERVRELDESRGDPGAARSAANQGIPLRRYGKPAEFGRVAAFLLSPAASYVSGAMIPVDGGALRSI
jgi:3-oxoacyl-[acyl-carrier protein] reductase